MKAWFNLNGHWNVVTDNINGPKMLWVLYPNTKGQVWGTETYVLPSGVLLTERTARSSGSVRISEGTITNGVLRCTVEWPLSKDRSERVQDAGGQSFTGTLQAPKRGAWP